MQNIWLVFTLVFVVLACFHFYLALQEIELFNFSGRESLTGFVGIGGDPRKDLIGSDIDQPIKDFIEKFNNYLSKYNKSNFITNVLAAIGYFGAAATASCLS